MIDLNNLIDFFPSYFKEYDSYKDSSGKGFLEKFLNICGSYLQTEPLADLRAYLESQSIENIDELYIKNLWEFLGEFPYLQEVYFDYNIFVSTFNGNNYEEAKEAAKYEQPSLLTWTNSQYTQRKILPYIIALYKIRGTDEFFNIIFRIFNITNYVTVKDKYADLGSYQSQVSSIYQNAHLVTDPKYIPTFDGLDSYDGTQLDQEFKCRKCITKFYIINVGTSVAHRDDIIKSIIALIKKFVPFYIQPYILVNGYNPSISIQVASALKSGSTTLFDGSVVPPPNVTVPSASASYFPSELNSYIPVKITVNCNDDLDIIEKGYYMGINFMGKTDVDTSKIYYDTSINIYNPGRYYFIPVKTYNPTNPINSTGTAYIDIQSIHTSQNFSLKVTIDSSSTHTQFDTPNDRITLKLVEKTTYQSIKTTYQNITASHFSIDTLDNIYLGEKPDKSQVPIEVGEKVGNSFVADWPGVYTFYLGENHNIAYSINLIYTENFINIIETPLFYMEDVSVLYVRNKNISKGSTTYNDWNALNQNNVKGVYILSNNKYVPHDFKVEFYAQDYKGDYLPIKINDKIYTPRLGAGNVVEYVNNNKVFEFAFNNQAGATNVDTSYTFSVVNHPELGIKIVQVRFIDDVIVPTVTNYKEFYINPNAGSYGINSPYVTDSANQVELSIEETVDFSGYGINSQLNSMALYGYIYVQFQGDGLSNVGSSTTGKEESGKRFMKTDGTLKGYLVPLRYSHRDGNSYVFKGNVTIDAGALKSALNLTGQQITLCACPVTRESVTGGFVKLTMMKVSTTESMLYLKMKDIQNYVFFSIPEEEDSEGWISKGTTTVPGVSTAYNKATLGYTSGDYVIPMNREFRIYIWSLSMSEGEEIAAKAQYVKRSSDGSFLNTVSEYSVNDESGEVNFPTGGITTIPFSALALNESSKVITFTGASANSDADLLTDTTAKIEITLRAPAHKAWLKYGSNQCDLGTNKTITIDLEGLTHKNISLQAFSNRIAPPYVVRLQDGTPINTGADGTFALNVVASLNNTKVYLDLNNSSAHDSATEPAFTLLVTDSSASS